MIMHPEQLDVLISQYGVYIYLILFLIVFGETGFVVLPFLPGDSLLFIAGAFAASGAMNVWILMALLISAAVLGNTLNYWIGSVVGHRIYDVDSRWISREALMKTHSFYEKHGGKTIVLARFVPLVRTFAPFVAGVSEMSWSRFQQYNILGAVLWVVAFVGGGYLFGNVPGVKEHLGLIALVGLSAAIVPVVGGVLWSFVKKTKAKKATL
ncbi:VTT domain-containing protein [Formosimonas limnophila]